MIQLGKFHKVSQVIISILLVTGSRTGADKEWPGRCTCDPSQPPFEEVCGGTSAFALILSETAATPKEF